MRRPRRRQASGAPGAGFSALSSWALVTVAVSFAWLLSPQRGLRDLAAVAVRDRARRNRFGRGHHGARSPVALSLNKLKRLGDAGLTDLFEADRKLWTAMAKDAYGYTNKFVRGSGNSVTARRRRPDADPGSRGLRSPAHVSRGTKALAEVLVRWFAELIVDRLWSDLN